MLADNILVSFPDHHKWCWMVVEVRFKTGRTISLRTWLEKGNGLPQSVATREHTVTLNYHLMH